MSVYQNPVHAGYMFNVLSGILSEKVREYSKQFWLPIAFVGGKIVSFRKEVQDQSTFLQSSKGYTLVGRVLQKRWQLNWDKDGV